MSRDWSEGGTACRFHAQHLLHLSEVLTAVKGSPQDSHMAAGFHRSR
jgi:hypothetical protein